MYSSRSGWHVVGILSVAMGRSYVQQQVWFAMVGILSVAMGRSYVQQQV
jgi:hypothetical protein